MSSECAKIVLLATALMALGATSAESCCSHAGKTARAGKGASADAMITVDQIDESIASLQRMKERIPPGQKGVSARELMAMELEELKRGPEYAKMSEADRKRLDAAIAAARRPSAAEGHDAGAKKPAATVPSHETVELSDGSRVFFVPRRRGRPSAARKGRR